MSANDQPMNDQPAIEEPPVDSAPNARKFRFTLASVFAVTVAFAVFFGIWRSLGAPLGIISVVLFLILLTREHHQSAYRIILKWGPVPWLALGLVILLHLLLLILRPL
ncbi:MAG: hypothetical protein N2C14_27625 [Planctomycetales bacterium]